MKVDEAQAALVVHEDCGAPVSLFGKFPFHLCIKSEFSQRHLVDGEALPQLGCNKDFMRSLGFFAAPRNLGHCAKETASALGWLDFHQLLGDFPIEGELLELDKG
jgi:hypothetical protein